MSTPERIVSILGEVHIRDTFDNFFLELLLQKLGLSKEQIRQHCEIRVRELPIPSSREGTPLYLSDDRITELWVQDCLIATIYEVRNANNFSQILFADYLTPDLIEFLQQTIAGIEGGSKSY